MDLMILLTLLVEGWLVMRMRQQLAVLFQQR
jgi:hypothetical protein